MLAGDLDAAMPLGVALDLHEHSAAAIRQLGDSDVTSGHWTGLVVDGSRAVGWMTATAREDRGPVRGIDFGPVARPHAPLPGRPLPGGGMGGGPGGPGLGFAPPEEGQFFPADAPLPVPPPGFELPDLAPGTSAGDDVPAAEPPAQGAPTTNGDPAPAAAPDAVTAFPRLDVPEQVQPGAGFEVVVGLARQAQAGVRGAVMTIPVEPDEPQGKSLVVQIKAENFTVPGVRHTLDFDPADVTRHTVRIPVTAPQVSEPWRGRIEVEYSKDGLLVGTAWRDLLVDDQAPADAPPSTAGGEVAVNLDRTVPIDLTVSISRGEADGTFLWTFTTPHPVGLPDEQVITHLDDDTAETFALRKVREMAQVDGSPTAELRVTGVAREVAGVMPLWFWKVLAPVWRIAKNEARLPTLLLVSQESLIPWELAVTDSDFIVDRSLVDETAPQILGAQLIVGRWRPAGPETPSGLRRPETTPAPAMTVSKLAVVVGEFGPSSGMRPLKQAIEEGQELKAAYPAVWVKGTASEVATLLKNRLTHEGEPVVAQVLHVASHGEVDPDSPINAGVILSDSAVRIDESIVAGSEFTRTAAPFVFLNACQLASETGGALVEGGLAAAFLQTGARAFIAPLWSVDDTIAKHTAVTFYAEALGKGRPVGEVMRELRARFTTEFPQRDQTTPLAYAYYGHPGLVLSRKET